VSEDVVHLPRYPQPFLFDATGRLALAVGLGLGGASSVHVHQLPVAPDALAKQESGGRHQYLCKRRGPGVGDVFGPDILPDPSQHP
jgi:hypothetical protein